MIESFWDPTTWADAEPHEFRIYGTADLEIYSLVDEEDYSFLSQWLWSPKVSKGGKKVYLRRNVETQLNNGYGKGRYECPETGKSIRNRQRMQRTLFLHTAVMWRTGIVPPSSAHHIVDHLDGNGMNCRRSNLRWATDSMNGKNVFGIAAKQGDLL